MIRVTKTEEGSRTVVTIDGELSADSVGLIEACCRQAELFGKPVHLFLRDVTMVDRAGQALLSRLASRGVHLEARGVYTAYLVQSLSPDNTEVNGFPVNGRGRHSNTI